MAYDAFPRARTDFTQNKQDILDALSHLGLSMNPGTCLYDAVWYALARLDGFPGRKAIFLIATGLDTVGGHGYPDLLKRAAAADAVIYPISVLQTGSRESENITAAQARNVLKSLADSSGGTAFFFNSEKEFPGIFETVGATLTNQSENSHPVRGARMPGEPIPGVTRYARTPGYHPSTPPACEAHAPVVCQ